MFIASADAAEVGKQPGKTAILSHEADDLGRVSFLTGIYRYEDLI